MHYDTIIIGAGPAGLFAAQTLGRHGETVLVLERNHKAGRKLLISGAGQCNFTHQGPIESFFNCYQGQEKFIKKALLTLDNQKTIAFFEKMGVASHTSPNQKVFPKSMKSQDILDALIRACQIGNVMINYNQYVTDISIYDHTFTVETEKGERYFSNHVILATGGKSYKHLGSDGKGYELAQSMGHTIIEPKPALTDVRIASNPYKELSGISIPNIEYTLWRNKKKIRTCKGDVLFTHKGLSGPSIINHSRWMEAGDILLMNFLYPSSYEEIKTLFIETLPMRGKEELITFLRSFKLPKNLLQVLCAKEEIDEHIPCARVDKVMREKIVKMLTQYEFQIDSLGNFNIAMATAGGVHLKEINPTTMESRKQPGLYLIGELNNIDGETGGYNIQAAFSMGYLSAASILKNKGLNIS